MDRLREAFPDARIASLMGDLEFIGDAWMAYLAALKIRFIPRLRENQRVMREGYETWTMTTIAKRLAQGQTMIVKGWCRLGQDANRQSPAVRLVVMRLPTGELLGLACSGNPRTVFAAYRGRWKIETRFGNLKTRGFNLEDTHITNANADKLSTLLGGLALAVALAGKTGVAVAR